MFAVAAAFFWTIPVNGFAFVANVLIFVVPRHATPIFGVCKIAKNKPRQFTTLGNCRGLSHAHNGPPQQRQFSRDPFVNELNEKLNVEVIVFMVLYCSGLATFLKIKRREFCVVPPKTAQVYSVGAMLDCSPAQF